MVENTRSKYLILKVKTDTLRAAPEKSEKPTPCFLAWVHVVEPGCLLWHPTPVAALERQRDTRYGADRYAGDPGAGSAGKP